MVYENIILLVHVLLAIGVVVFVLLQRGKGADAGASFGGGASQTVFGSSGSGNFLTRSTAVLVAAFFVTSMALAYVAKQRADALVDINVPTTQQAAPVENDVPVVVPSSKEGALPTE